MHKEDPLHVCCHRRLAWVEALHGVFNHPNHPLGTSIGGWVVFERVYKRTTDVSQTAILDSTRTAIPTLTHDQRLTIGDVPAGAIQIGCNQ